MEAEVGAGPGPKNVGPRVQLKVGCLTGGLAWQVGGIVIIKIKWRAKQGVMTKWEEVFCLPNGLAESLGENF